MTELEQKAEDYEIDCVADVYKDDICELQYAYSAQKLEQAYKDGYEQGQDEAKIICSQTNKRAKCAFFSENEKLIKLEKENEELKQSVTEKNSEVEELKEELKNYAKVINELMGTRLDDTEEVGRLIKIAQYRNWSEL